MPPPPPPSKSYLLVLDTSSSSSSSSCSEDEGDRIRRFVGVDHPVPLLLNDGSSSELESRTTMVEVVENENIKSDDVNVEKNDDVEQDEKNEESNTTPPKKKKKKKRKKRRKKKKKKKESRSVSFGTISVREHSRTMGSDGVPGEGGWPLGLSFDVVREYDVCGGVDGFESRKQSELGMRWEELAERDAKRRMERELNGSQGHSGGRKGGKRHGKKAGGKGGGNNNESRPSVPVIEPVPVPSGVLETRQFDYKKRSDPSESSSKASSVSVMEDNGKNHLFGIMPEEQRMTVLLRDSGSNMNPPSSPTNAKHQHRYLTRSRSSSITDRYVDSNDGDNGDEGPFSAMNVSNTRNELEQIRNSRSKEGRAGCSCRKIHVNIYNNGNNGRRSSHRRMAERRVKEELRKRGLLDHDKKTPSRDDMEKMLYDAVNDEPCCWGKECPCVRNGIGCQADTCSCWHPSHGDGKEKACNDSDASLSVGAMKDSCGNRYGMYVVDVETIRQHRVNFIASYSKV